MHRNICPIILCVLQFYITMAGKDTSDEAFKQMINQIESGKQYKVLTQHEYEALLAISSKKI